MRSFNFSCFRLRIDEIRVKIFQAFTLSEAEGLTPGKKRLDRAIIGIYNVITMITTLIAIGNSRGVRIPKPLITESGLGDQVELKVKKGEIRIIAAPMKDTSVNATLLLSEKALSVDWNRPEEDAAWASLQ